MQRGNDRAIRERQSPIAEGLDRNIVAQLGAQLLESSCSCQLLDRDQAPVTKSLRELDPVDGRSLAVRLSRDRSGGGDCAGEHANPNERENNQFHGDPPSNTCTVYPAFRVSGRLLPYGPWIAAAPFGRLAMTAAGCSAGVVLARTVAPPHSGLNSTPTPWLT